MQLRPFRQGDEDELVRLWNQRMTGCFATPPITPEIFLRDVTGKHYFDPEGLVLVFDSGRLVAFVHAGFKSKDWITPDPRQGTISMLVVEKHHIEAGVVAIRQGIRYLLRCGARQIEAFTIDFPHTPFYNGLYGGEKAGMDEDHPLGLALMKRTCFQPASGGVIMTCDLDCAIHPAPPLDGLDLRVEEWQSPIAGLKAADCYGIPERVRRARLVDANGVEKAGITFWHLDRYNQATGDRLAVVSHVGSVESIRGSGAPVALQREVHRILSGEGARRMALGTGGANGRAVSFYRKAGYRVLRNAWTFYLDWNAYDEVTR